MLYKFEVCLCISPVSVYQLASLGSISTEVNVGGGRQPWFDPRVTGGLYDGDSHRGLDNRKTIHALCVVCATGLHTCMNPLSMFAHLQNARTDFVLHECAGGFVSVCMTWVLVSAALKAEQFAHSKVHVQQITVFASPSPHIPQEIPVSTAKLLLCIYPMDYIRQIIGDNRVA